MDVTFGKSLLSGGPLLSGIARKVQKLTLLSASRYFRGAATLGTLRYPIYHCTTTNHKSD